MGIWAETFGVNYKHSHNLNSLICVGNICSEWWWMAQAQPQTWLLIDWIGLGKVLILLVHEPWTVVLKELPKKISFNLGFFQSRWDPPPFLPRILERLVPFFESQNFGSFGAILCVLIPQMLWGKKWPKSFGFGQPPPFFLEYPYTDVSWSPIPIQFQVY